MEDSHENINSIDKKIRNVLRLGVFQLVFSKFIPAYSACNETVDLAKRLSHPKVAGFVNGVMRSIARSEQPLVLPDKAKEPVEYLSLKYSMSEKIIRKLIPVFGLEETEQFCAACLERPDLYIRVNTLVTDPDTLLQSLIKQGFEAEKSAAEEAVLKLKSASGLFDTPEFNRGAFVVMDESKWKEYIPFDGPVHKTGKDFAQGFFHYWSGLDSNVFFDIPDGVFALCREIIKGNILPEKLNEDQKYLFSIAIEKKLFIKEGDNFKQNYYFIRHGELKQIEQLAYEFYPVAQEFFNKAYKLVLDEYKTTVPKHLHWQMGNFLSNHLGNFVTCSLYEGVRSGILSTPDESNKDWLSLFTAE